MSEASNVGLAVDIGELALAQASINNAQNPVAAEVNIAGVAAAVPTNLTAPSAVVLAACLYTPKRTGLMLITYSLQYSISGAGSLVLLFQIVPAATAIAGGAFVGGAFHVENGGTAVSLTGASPATLITVTKTHAAAASTETTYGFPTGGPLHGQLGYQLVVTSAVNITAMIFSASVTELL
jgi:hypothetical protein